LAAIGSGSILAACGSSSSTAATTAAPGSTAAATDTPTTLTAAATTADAATTVAGAGAVTTFSVQLSWVADSEFAQLFLADANGHYKDKGVAVKLVPGGPDIGAIEGLVAGGKVDIGIATDITSVVAAVADGNPLVVIGALYQKNLNTFMSPPDKPVKDVASMLGKRIGGPQGVQPKFDAVFKIAGLEPKYTFVPTGFGPDALINGDCDVQAGFITDEVLAYKRTTGKDVVQFGFEEAGLPAYTLPIFVTADTLKNKRAALVAFLAATLKGAQDNEKDPKAGAKLAAEVYGKDADLKLAEEYEKNAAYVPLQSSDLTKSHSLMWVDPDRLAGPIFKGMVAAGLKTVDVAKVLDTSLMVDAAK
jgi:NitT/TauT family transport system substrate-binding protein